MIEECSQGPHRPPEGPNEDAAVCPECGSVSWMRRLEGETYGWHADDCALEIDHLGRCQHGGKGHPPAPVIRGYWPDDIRSKDFRG